MRACAMAMGLEDEPGGQTPRHLDLQGRQATKVARTERQPWDRFGRWTTPALGAVLCLITIALRLRFATASGVVDADESVIFIMARRIAQLRDFPVFHYGNSYLGSLDAVVAAVFMRLLGASALVGRLTPMALSVLLVWSTFRLGVAAADRRVGYLAATFVALGPTLLVVWGAKLHLGYLDILILGNLLLVGALRLTDGSCRSEEHNV